MAREIQVKHSSSKTVYATVHNQTSGFLWNLSGPSFESFVSGNWPSYGISLTEQGVSAFYAGNFPSTIAPGVYSSDAREQLGAGALQTDPTVAVGDLNWNGSIVMPLADLATSGQVGQIAPIRLARGTMIQNFPFKMVSSADHSSVFVSGIISGQISRDGGSFGVLQSGLFTEVGLGWYKTNLTSGDLLANTAALVFTGVGVSGGSADQRDMAFILQRVSGQ